MHTLFAHRTYSLLFILISISLALWYPTRHLPYWWDASGFVVQSSRWLIEHDFMPLITTHSNFAHPPLFTLFLALAWVVVGQSVLVSHLLLLPFLPLLVASVYFFSRKWLSDYSAFVVALLTLCTPVVIAEYGNVYLDLPSAALGWAGLSSWFYTKRTLGVLLLTASVLTKMPVLILCFIPLFYTVLSRHLKAITFYKQLAVPFLAVIAWLSYHYGVTGWFLIEPGRPLLTPGLSAWSDTFRFIFRLLFLEQGRFMVSGLFFLLVSTSVIGRALRSWKTIDIAVFLTLLVGFIFFFLAGELAQRYAIFWYPLLYFLTLRLLSVYAARNLKGSMLASLGPSLVGLLFAGFFVLLWHPKQEPIDSFQFQPPSDLRYMDMITLFTEVADYLSLFQTNSDMYGGFPENLQLTQPQQGYVQARLAGFKLCSEFTEIVDVTQVLILHPFSPSQLPCHEIAQHYPHRLLRVFEVNGHWVRVVELEAP